MSTLDPWNNFSVQIDSGTIIMSVLLLLLIIAAVQLVL